MGSNSLAFTDTTDLTNIHMDSVLDGGFLEGP